MAHLSDPAHTVMFAQNRQAVNDLLNRPAKQGFSSRINQQSVWGYILAVEITEGTSFLYTKEHNMYVCLGLNRQIFPIFANGLGSDGWHAYLHQRYGLAENEGAAKIVYSLLKHYIISQGDRVEMRRFVVYNPQTNCLYMSNYDGSMWKLDGDEPPQLIANGDDKIFFADDDNGAPCPDMDYGLHNLLFDSLTDLAFTETALGGITPDQQRKILIVWMLMLAFPDLMPTKPMLIVEGSPGAGKTAATQLVQTALMGKTKAMIVQRNKEDDFGVTLMRSPIAVLDNLDSYIDWIPDAVCAYATAGHWVKRKLYSNDTEHIIQPHAFIAVASKNPASFRREDVVDRSLIIRLERRASFTPMQALVKNVQDNRPKLLGEYLYYVNQILAELAITGPNIIAGETHRMADFAAFARIVARVCDWDPDEISHILDAIQSERDAFVNEEDPLSAVLEEWLNNPAKQGPKNLGREISANVLFYELEAHATKLHTTFYKTPRLLTQKLRSPHLAKDFRVEEVASGGHRLYRIWRRTDPQLRLVSEVHDTDVIA